METKVLKISLSVFVRAGALPQIKGINLLTAKGVQPNMKCLFHLTQMKKAKPPLQHMRLCQRSQVLASLFKSRKVPRWLRQMACKINCSQCPICLREACKRPKPKKVLILASSQAHQPRTKSCRSASTDMTQSVPEVARREKMSSWLLQMLKLQGKKGLLRIHITTLIKLQIMT